MEEQHKKILRRNRINLVTKLDISNLSDSLLQKEIFTQDMIVDIKRFGTRRDQARKLVRDLETRGSRAFPLFLECLQETGHHELVKMLQKGAPPVHLQPVKPVKVVRPILQPLPVSSPMDTNKKNKDVDFCLERPDTTSGQSPESGYQRLRPPARTRRDSIQSYKMDASPCGHCLIINNVDFEPRSELSNRKGSNVDCDKLKKRFKALNFIVEVKTNLRQKQIRHELKSLAERDHSQYDCCVVIMLSHGTEVSHNRFPGAVYGVDGQFVSVQQITNFLNGQNCPTLQSKPKLFFIQACGGGEKDTGFEVSPEDGQKSVCREDDQMDAIPMSSSSDSLSTPDETDAKATLPTSSDILVSYSTFPGYVSWRDTKSGSWFVETLDRILEENADTEDLITMLTMVNNEVSQNSAKGLYKQMPGSFNFLRKTVFFQMEA